MIIEADASTILHKNYTIIIRNFVKNTRLINIPRFL